MSEEGSESKTLFVKVPGRAAPDAANEEVEQGRLKKIMSRMVLGCCHV